MDQCIILFLNTLCNLCKWYFIIYDIASISWNCHLCNRKSCLNFPFYYNFMHTLLFSCFCCQDSVKYVFLFLFITKFLIFRFYEILPLIVLMRKNFPFNEFSRNIKIKLIFVLLFSLTFQRACFCRFYNKHLHHFVVKFATWNFLLAQFFLILKISSHKFIFTTDIFNFFSNMSRINMKIFAFVIL